MTPDAATSTAETEPPVVLGRALRADARRNREAVLAAAKELFADQGLDAQMPDVAKAANVGVGTVYRHFPTKDHLIAALVAERFERLAAKARDGLGAPDAWEGVSSFIRYAAQTQADDRGLCEVMGSRPEMMNDAAGAAGLPELCDSLVKRAQGSGQLRRDLEWEDIPMIACGLGSVTQASPVPSVGRWPRLVEIILDGLRAPGSGKLPRPL
ncbi:MAG: TetR/AcrR family transcriptional regulator [Solirubrobacterales bacterium]|nr:TetR/AcrR family transcriptional regulator [Solirubrobacterales bacterium]